VLKKVRDRNVSAAMITGIEFLPHQPKKVVNRRDQLSRKAIALIEGF
jgi:hypothetical protein